MVSAFTSFFALAALAAATPLRSRAVDSLNEEATAEAHQRDNGATRAFSDVQIRVCELEKGENRRPVSAKADAGVLDIRREMSLR